MFKFYFKGITTKRFFAFDRKEEIRGSGETILKFGQKKDVVLFPKLVVIPNGYLIVT